MSVGVLPFSSISLNIPSFSFTELLYELEADPMLFFVFLVPVLMVVVYFIILKINALRRKVDSEPTFIQEKETFKLPEDYINEEMLYVQGRDYDHFEANLEDSSRKIKALSKYLTRKARKYRRMKYRITYTASERTKKKLAEKMQKEFKEIMSVYATIQKVTIDLDLSRIKEE
jgi:5-bromo-4-chloroindolyl phosphate hydrolysis protein